MNPDRCVVGRCRRGRAAAPGGRRARLALVLVWLCVPCVGCGRGVTANPSFVLDVRRARGELASMAADPRPLQRPLVVLGGYLDPGLVSGQLAAGLRRATGDRRVLSVAFGNCWTFDACRDRLVEAVQRAFPAEEATATTPVDVVGVSMGGLVARHARLPAAGRRRLAMARLFTIATPHRGAKMADIPTLNPLQIAMRPGSAFLATLDAADPRDYELRPYVRLDDFIVGPPNAAPPGEVAWWVPNRPLEAAHAAAYRDPRIVADIARCLRGDKPYTTLPRTPLPGAENADLSGRHGAERNVDPPPRAGGA